MPQSLAQGSIWSDPQTLLSLANQNINAGASQNIQTIGAIRFRINWIHFTSSVAGKIRIRVDATSFVEMTVLAATPVILYWGEFAQVWNSSPGDVLFINDGAGAISVNLKGGYQLRA